MKYEYEELDDLTFCNECEMYYDIASNNEYGFFCCKECAHIKIEELADDIKDNKSAHAKAPEAPDK